jgi:hypothetical protein
MSASVNTFHNRIRKPWTQLQFCFNLANMGGVVVRTTWVGSLGWSDVDAGRKPLPPNSLSANFGTGPSLHGHAPRGIEQL